MTCLTRVAQQRVRTADEDATLHSPHVFWVRKVILDNLLDYVKGVALLQMQVPSHLGAGVS